MHVAATFPHLNFSRGFFHTVLNMGCRTARLVPGGGAVLSDGTDLRELLSVSGWYRRQSAITGWLGIHHVVHSRTFTTWNLHLEGSQRFCTWSHGSTACFPFSTYSNAQFLPFLRACPPSLPRR